MKPEDIGKAVSEAAMPAATEAAALLAADREEGRRGAAKKAPAADPYEAGAASPRSRTPPEPAPASEAVKRGVDDAIEAERAHIVITPAPVVREDGAAKTGGDDVQVTSLAGAERRRTRIMIGINATGGRKISGHPGLRVHRHLSLPVSKTDYSHSQYRRRQSAASSASSSPRSPPPPRRSRRPSCRDAGGALLSPPPSPPKRSATPPCASRAACSR